MPHARARGSGAGGLLGLYRGEGGFGESVGRTPPRRARTLYEPASADAVRGLQIDTCRGQGCRGREGRLASAGWGGSGGGREGLA